MNDAEQSLEAAEPKPLAGKRDAYLLLRNRDFRLYLLGRLSETIGRQMLDVTIGWEIYDRTHSAWALSLVGLTQIVPILLLTLPAGHLADNYNRKKIIVVMTLALAAVSLALAAVSALHTPIRWIYLCLLLMGVARTFLWAASASFMPQLVERKDFSHAVNWNASMFQLSAILGPAAGGAIIALTGHRAAPVYALYAVAALTCCVLMLFIRQAHVVAVREKMTLRGLLTGFRFVFAKRIIVGTITLDMFAVLLGGATALLPIYASQILRVGPFGLGILTAALPLGAVVCTFILAHRPPLQKAGRDLLWAVVMFGLATIAFGFSRWFWFSFLMLFVCGAVDNISVVVRHTLVQMLTPDEKRGRVSAVNNLFIGTSNELGGWESNAVAHLFGPTMGNTRAAGAVISAVGGGVGTIVVVLAVALIWPEIRKFGRLDTAGQS